MKIHELMTRNVRCVQPSTTLMDAALLMRKLDVGAIPVCGENDQLVGMITDRDITIRAVADSRDPKTSVINDVLSPGVISVFEDQPVDAAATLMEKYQVRRLPVLNAARRLVGIISLGDIAAGAAHGKSGEVLEEVSAPGESHVEDPANR